MKRLLLLNLCLSISVFVFSTTIVVRNIEELKKANQNAKPGDIIILQNGEWMNVKISLTCNGTKEQPIIFKAETPGRVSVSGFSQLKLGGNFIVVEGLQFINGYSGDDAVIEYRANKQVANNCRVTNCVVNDFNNQKRTDENYWVAFYGKHNRLDNSSFLNKKNLGVLLAVILDDDRSRENFHSIDHNYFGVRQPLASNGGEIIRVGVSQHCQFNSNTNINNNFFEHCDGETEIISIKSCRNIVKDNVFKECQGSVVLRHGDFNTVENNLFLGNNKEGTGGVRVINKGQWVINNLFYKCRGVGFRSPLAVMNGIPNSPANRYVQVTDAVIANNSFFQCSPISLCEGSDTERTLPPMNAVFAQNIFYNIQDKILYKAYDDIRGFSFSDNKFNKGIIQKLPVGFAGASLKTQSWGAISIPLDGQSTNRSLLDSLNRINHGSAQLQFQPGFHDISLVKALYQQAINKTGASWFKKSSAKINSITVDCINADEIYTQLDRKEPVTIRLTGRNYFLNKPFIINKPVEFISKSGTTIDLKTEAFLSTFILSGNGNLSLINLSVNGAGVHSVHFISSDTAGSSNHYNLALRNCSFSNLDRKNGCNNFFYAFKNMIADSIVFRGNNFLNLNCNLVRMNEETDNKGYYNAEKIIISNNKFHTVQGTLIDLYRGGNDESTLGPLVMIKNNDIRDCNSASQSTLIKFFGIQKTIIEKNTFNNCNKGSVLIQYEDLVRADHLLTGNVFKSSGIIHENKYLLAKNNSTR